MTEAASPQVRRDLRAITADGVAFSGMVGLGETYVPAFALAVGLGVELAVFAALFAAAMTSRLVSSGFLAAQSEAPGLAASHRSLGAAPVWQRLRSAGSVRVLTYLLGMQAATHVAAPYFTPYMLGPLDLSYGRLMALIAASFASRVAVLPLLGGLAHLWLPGIRFSRDLGHLLSCSPSRGVPRPGGRLCMAVSADSVEQRRQHE